MAACAWLYEKRPLKKPKLGPPDVYPQEPKQKEDELTSTNVKQGFACTPQVNEEYGTARNCNITPAQFRAFFSAILSKKQDLNTFQESTRRRQPINTKDNFWPVTARSKNALDAWFKDLAGSKTLTSLAKKVPISNKKEEIFVTLYEFSVPMLRAAWFIKMSSAHAVAISEAKIKKRQHLDPSQEWTQALCKFLRDLAHKLCTGSDSPAFTSMCGVATSMTPEALTRQWHYCCTLAHHLYEEGLLDRQEFLSWCLELFEKTKTPDEPVLRLLMPLILQYLDEFINSEVLSRRLAYHCAKKLGQMIADPPPPSNNTPAGTPAGSTVNGNTNSAPNGQTPPLNPLAASVLDLLNCSFHRQLVLGFSAVIQAVCLDCPSALVWNQLGEGRGSSVLSGSPLDLLPCAPSALPMPPGAQNAPLRAELALAEQHIKERSQAAESRWACDKWNQSVAGVTIQKMLSALDALDRHCFDKVEPGNSLDTLYAKVFPADQKPGSESEEPIINLLCEWAVTTRRTGEYRALVVARLLEKRQNDVTAVEKCSDVEMADEKDSQDSTGPMGLPLYQNLLVAFLDNQAPVLEEKSTADNKQSFANLVLLFCELVRQEVFSHDGYMCTLISRGSFASLQAGGLLLPPAPRPPAEPPLTGFMMEHPLVPSRSLPMFEPPPDHHSVNIKHETDMDDARLDADLDQILQHIKEGQQQNMSDQPDSVGSDKEDEPVGGASGGLGLSGGGNNSQQHALRRHLQYTTHFPLPMEEPTASYHDSNQRHILLYGVGKARDDARHLVKKVTKEILKLFSKKTSMDISEGAKVKKHAREALSFETAVSRFQNLSYFDQHVVSHSCANHVVEMLGSFASGSSNYLPLVEHIAFLMELMEAALYLTGLLEFAVQLLKELPDVETQLAAKNSALAGSYATSIGLYIIGELYRYHCCLLVMPDLTSTVFEGLVKLVKHATNPTSCSSAERCILCYLYDLYTSCHFLKSKHSDRFGPLYQKLNLALFQKVTPSALNQRWNSTFMLENINNPRMKVDPQLIKELNENPVNRYSFICNAVIKIYEAKDADRLNEISLLCAELTANCQTLSAEWLGVLKAICNSSNHGCGFIDVLTHIDESDLSIYDNLAVFTSLLIARRCFSLEVFMFYVAMPSLMASLGGGRSNNAQSGSRLTCHLLMRLYKMGEMQPPLAGGSTPMAAAPGQRSLYHIRNSCDRHLLSAAHNSSIIQAIMAVLKAVIILGNSTGGGSSTEAKGSRGETAGAAQNNKGEIAISDLLGKLDDPDFDINISGGGTQPSTNAPGTETELTDFAKHSLRQMCSQEWVHERCLRDPDLVCSADVLLDPMLSNQLAQQLLRMICHPRSPPESFDQPPDQKQVVTSILQSLDIWTLRVSLLELQLMYQQCSKVPGEVGAWLETVARVTVQHLTDLPRQGEGSGMRVWMVAPLISKLPPTVQGKVLKAAGQVLENGAWAPPSTSQAKAKDKDTKPPPKNSQPGSHQPFLSLVLMCLKGQEEQREGLLTSLSTQISQFLHPAKDEQLSPEMVHAMQEPLRLRLSLLGGMFDTVQKSPTLTVDWACLLAQLITNGAVDPHLNMDLFTTVLDMLAVLVHTAQVPEPSISSEETRKHHLNLVKKLKKEIAEKTTEAVKLVKHLLPLPKPHTEVIRCEPTGSLIDTKGNKIAGFDSIEKKQGLQVAQKQIVIPWDLLEGHKNPTPLSWTWFGAVRAERKPLRQEEAQRLLLWHTHNMRKPSSYFYEAPMLPPDDLEPTMQPDKPSPYYMVPDDKRPPLDHSPRGYAKKAKQPRNPKKRQTKMVTGQIPGPPIRPGMPYAPEQIGYPQAPGQQPQPPQQQVPQGWGGYGGGQYYAGGAQQPRFERPAPGMSQSKAALSSMLRARHPSTQQFQQYPPNPTLDMKRHMMMRQIRPQGHMPPPQPQQPSMYAHPGAPPQAAAQGTAPLHHLPHPPPPQGTQNYGSYSGGSILEPTGRAGPPPPPMGAGGTNYPGMMQPQYMASNRQQYPGAAAGAAAGPPPHMYQGGVNPMQQQQLRQQQMMAMQQQQQKLAQLQRINPQHHQYSHPY